MRGFVVLAGLLLALPAGASPWPREAGRHFMASTTLVSARGTTNSLWFERGTGPGRWFVAEGRLAPGLRAWAVGISWHRALPDRGDWKLAWSFGVQLEMADSGLAIDLTPPPFPGQRVVRIRYLPMASARFGVSMGRGLQHPWPGWASLDLQLDLNIVAPRLQAEATLGYRPSERLAVILQAQTQIRHDTAPGLALSSSVVWRWRPGLRLEVGLRHDLRGGRSALKLGSWFEF